MWYQAVIPYLYVTNFWQHSFKIVITNPHLFIYVTDALWYHRSDFIIGTKLVCLFYSAWRNYYTDF